MGALDGRVAVVTGGASGMGAGTVRRFVEEGAKVVIADVLDARGKELAEELGEPATFTHCDVRREEDVKDTVELAVERHGRLDCMFNNAGAGGSHTDIDQIELNEWEDFLAILLRGPFLGMKYAARVMKRQRSGSVINTTSVAGLRACNGPHPYSAAKAGLDHLSKAVAMELATYGVRVNCICPGAILTPIFGSSAGLSHADAERAMSQVGDLFREAQPIPITGLPSDIASAAVFLASEESRFITGHTLVVDGGLIVGREWQDVKAQWNEIRKLLGVEPEDRHRSPDSTRESG